LALKTEKKHVTNFERRSKKKSLMNLETPLELKEIGLSKETWLLAGQYNSHQLSSSFL
jgi:hypothetical protein